MLTWIRDPDGWHANGFHIKLVSQYHWILLDNAIPDSAVHPEHRPLASATTLTLCKREAELIQAGTLVRERRRRSVAELLLAIAGLILVIGAASLWGYFLGAILLGFMTRAVGFLIGSYAAQLGLSGNVDRMYQ